MNAVSRERFTPAAVADAVIVWRLRAPAPPILWLDAPLTRKECIEYRVLHESRLQKRVDPGANLRRRQRQFLHLPVL